jgi:hypothetical protein
MNVTSLMQGQQGHKNKNRGKNKPHVGEPLYIHDKQDGLGAMSVAPTWNGVGGVFWQTAALAKNRTQAALIMHCFTSLRQTAGFCTGYPKITRVVIQSVTHEKISAAEKMFKMKQ